jgi:hypothetical protein
MLAIAQALLRAFPAGPLGPAFTPGCELAVPTKAVSTAFSDNGFSLVRLAKALGGEGR